MPESGFILGCERGKLAFHVPLILKDGEKEANMII
jgi:hypothetical protein